jgi:tRNA(adenine34) deaminase
VEKALFRRHTTARAAMLRCAATTPARAALRGVRARAHRARLMSRASTSAAAAAAGEDVGVDDERHMRRALELARDAARAGEVPIGAVLVDAETSTVICEARNTCEHSGDPTAHAEMTLIQEGAKKLGGWRALQRTTMYVTLEPCAMCAGAILQSRVGGVVYGAKNTLLGGDGSWVSMLRRDDVGTDDTAPKHPHAFAPNLEVRSGVLAEDCGKIMSDFFKHRRTLGVYGDDAV